MTTIQLKLEVATRLPENKLIPQTKIEFVDDLEDLAADAKCSCSAEDDNPY